LHGYDDHHISKRTADVLCAGSGGNFFLSSWRDWPTLYNTVYARRIDSSALVFSLSSHRHSYIGLLFSSRFID
jgi:hypothetical protein